MKTFVVGMDGGGYPGAHPMQYPNQQQMWDNFYTSHQPPEDHNNGGVRYPPGPMSPHMGMEGWWQGGPPPPHLGGPDLGPYRMGSPGMPPVPGPWAMRGPRPRGERRGPGRPRLTSKGERGARPRNPSGPGASPFFPGGPEGLPPEMMGSPGEMKRGPGRPKAMMDPNAPKDPTTKNGNKKRYTCEVCQKRFSTAWYVRVHRRSHNGERPYVCNNCGKGFMLPNVLQVHLRKCEKNNPPTGGSVGGTGPQGPIALTPRQSDSVTPNPTSSPGLPGGPSQQPPPGFGFPGGDPSGIPQSQNQPFPGMGAFNQRYMGGGGMTPPHLTGQTSYTPNLGQDIPLNHHQQFPPDHPAHAAYGRPEHPPPRLDDTQSPGGGGGGGHNQFSPIYSPTSLPPPPSSSENSEQLHFLANDKPRDPGGGGTLNINSLSPGSGLAHHHTHPPNVLPQQPPPATNNGGRTSPNYCATCDIKFEDKCAAEEHLKTHRPFSCEICEKRFSQKCNLVTHLRLHTGEKPYNCDFCEKRFTQKGNLDAHIKTHTKEKPFSCQLCAKRFSFKASLDSHVRKHQEGTLGLDDDEDDVDKIKLHAHLQSFGGNGGPPHQLPPAAGVVGEPPPPRNDFEYATSEEFDSNPSPSLSPPHAQFGAVLHNRLVGVGGGSGGPGPDISNHQLTTDTRQSLALQ